MSHHQINHQQFIPTALIPTASNNSPHNSSAPIKNPYKGWQWFLAAKLVWRDFKGGELFIDLALVLAVTVIIQWPLTDRLEDFYPISEFLARKLIRSKPLSEWINLARAAGAAQSISDNDRSRQSVQLTSVKAVSSECLNWAFRNPKTPTSS